MGLWERGIWKYTCSRGFTRWHSPPGCLAEKPMGWEAAGLQREGSALPHLPWPGSLEHCWNLDLMAFSRMWSWAGAADWCLCWCLCCPLCFTHKCGHPVNISKLPSEGHHCQESKSRSVDRRTNTMSGQHARATHGALETFASFILRGAFECRVRTQSWSRLTGLVHWSELGSWLALPFIMRTHWENYWPFHT